MASEESGAASSRASSPRRGSTPPFVGTALRSATGVSLSQQLAAIAITIAIAIVGTVVCARLVGLVCPLRVSERDERVGLDISQHGERAYPAFNGLDD